MKKKIVLSMIAILAATSISAFADINIKVNGENVPFSSADNYGVPFVDENNRTLVPFRKTLEFAGATVGWNAESKTAIAEKNGIKVEVPIGQKYIFIDGAKQVIDTNALIKEGRTYLPIRAVLEALEYEIGWEQATQTVIAMTEDYVAEEVVVDNDVITEEKVVPLSQAFGGKLSGNILIEEEVTHVRLLPESPFQLSKKNIVESGDKIIDAYIEKRENGYATMLFFVDGELVYKQGGYFNEDEGKIGYFIQSGKDYSDYDQLGFFSYKNESEIIVFDNPFK